MATTVAIMTKKRESLNGSAPSRILGSPCRDVWLGKTDPAITSAGFVRAETATIHQVPTWHAVFEN